MPMLNSEDFAAFVALALMIAVGTLVLFSVLSVRVASAKVLRKVERKSSVTDSTRFILYTDGGDFEVGESYWSTVKEGDKISKRTLKQEAAAVENTSAELVE